MTLLMRIPRFIAFVTCMGVGLTLTLCGEVMIRLAAWCEDINLDDPFGGDIA